MIYNQLRNDIREIIIRLCQYRGVEIIEGHLMSDHVHMLVMIPPKLSVSSFMGYLKGKSALMILIDMQIWNINMEIDILSEGYYVSTVGLNDQTVAKYIREQEGHDIAMDKLSVKEYQNPFEDKEMKKKNKKERRR
ncbi:MAG: IS200/IS605 family transposase [Thomasclavelia ramosa]